MFKHIMKDSEKLRYYLKLSSQQKEKLKDELHSVLEKLPACVVYEEITYYEDFCNEWEKNQDLDDLHDRLVEMGYYEDTGKTPKIFYPSK